jgi:protein-S-isoprenylcysteine O-methyltransferase Ste14
LAGDLAVLGIVIMGWNPGSLAYLLLWVFFIAYLTFTHVAMVTEEKANLDKFGPAYRGYMDKVPRYFWPFK